VPAHIEGVRRAAQLGIRANAAIFPYLGHWSNLMFGSHLDLPSPLSAPTAPTAPATGESGPAVGEEIDSKEGGATDRRAT
jgi:hypothetical protein